MARAAFKKKHDIFMSKSDLNLRSKILHLKYCLVLRRKTVQFGNQSAKTCTVLKLGATEGW